MLFITLITLIICKALLSERLSLNFSYRITSIILLLTAYLNYNTLLNFDIVTGIGIYNGLFHITYITQIIEIFLLITGSIILISWPFKTELITEISTAYAVEPVGRGNQTTTPQLESFFEHQSNYPINYSIIVLFCTLGASLLISCSDLISMYLSIELQSFSLYVLSTLYKNSELSTSAGLKYFLLGGLSSCLILFGAGLIYAYTGLTNFESIYSFLSIYSIEINNNFLGSSEGVVGQIIYPLLSEGYNLAGGPIYLGFIFVFVGFLFKVSAAPFHNWSPDVYDETPTIVTIWLTLIPKISILILLLELHIHIDLIDQLSQFDQLKLFSFNIDTITKNLLLISSLLSLIIGSVVGLAQNRIKRLLAYSTISHIGYILLALGIYTEQSIDSFIFYIIQYIITNLNIFLIILALSYIINQSINEVATSTNSNSSQQSVPTLHTARNGEISDLSNSQGQEAGVLILQRDSSDKSYFKDIRYISEFKGQFYSNPLISLSFSICLFSIAGIPPLIGFFSKQFVLYSAIQSGYNFIALVAIFVSVISASYYLKIIKTFFIDFESPTHSGNYPLNPKEKAGAVGAGGEHETLFKSDPAFTPGTEPLKLNNSHSFIISTLTLSILFFIFKPSLILNITQLLSLSLFYT